MRGECKDRYLTSIEHTKSYYREAMSFDLLTPIKC